MSRPKVLVLDDSPSVLARAELLLGSAFAVSSASDWITANRLAHQDPPDLVVVDWKLEGFEGSYLVRAFRLFFGEALPIVLISADDAGAKAADEAGASAFLGKRDLDRLPALLAELHGARRGP